MALQRLTSKDWAESECCHVRKVFHEPQIVGSNPTRPALLLVLAKAGSVNSSYCCSVPLCWARLGIDGVTLREIVGHEGRKDWPGNVNVGF